MPTTEQIDAYTVTFQDANHPTQNISLRMMQEGMLARNNCYNAAHAVSETLVQHIQQDAYVVGLIFNNAEHWASAIQEGSNSVLVIDYTMRQFAVGANIPEANIPFPFVGSYNEWKATIEGWAAARWDESLVETVTEEVVDNSQ